MAATGSGRRNAPFWIDIPLSLVAFVAVWMGVTVLLNLSGGDPAFSGGSDPSRPPSWGRPY